MPQRRRIYSVPFPPMEPKRFIVFTDPPDQVITTAAETRESRPKRVLRPERGQNLRGCERVEARYAEDSRPRDG